MARHQPSSMSHDEELSATDPIVSDSMARSDKLQEQLRSSERLNEYYNQVVAELRASLEEIGEGDGRAA